MRREKGTNENGWRSKHLVCGFSTGTLTSYALLSSPYVEKNTAFMLTGFNFFFVSLTFPLKGSLPRKLFLLLVGNAVGFLWDSILSLFAKTADSYFGESVNIVYVILSPFASLIWIVSFWSMSLTVLADSKKEDVEATV